jgi:hypothetical protein
VPGISASRKYFCLHWYVLNNTLRNVVIVTNIRRQVSTEVGNERQARSKDLFKPILENGARRGFHKDATFAAETIKHLTLVNSPNRCTSRRNSSVDARVSP